jgi:hypothetical protein
MWAMRMKRGMKPWTPQLVQIRYEFTLMQPFENNALVATSNSSCGVSSIGNSDANITGIA